MVYEILERFVYTVQLICPDAITNALSWSDMNIKTYDYFFRNIYIRKKCSVVSIQHLANHILKLCNVG